MTFSVRLTVVERCALTTRATTRTFSIDEREGRRRSVGHGDTRSVGHVLPLIGRSDMETLGRSDMPPFGRSVGHSVGRSFGRSVGHVFGRSDMYTIGRLDMYSVGRPRPSAVASTTATPSVVARTRPSFVARIDERAMATSNASDARESLTGARIANRTISGAVVRARFESRRHVKDLNELEREIHGAYGFAGVVTEHARKVDRNGRPFASMRVGELKNGGSSVNVLVFGDAYEAYGKEGDANAGRIVAVFDAKFSRERCVAIEETAQMLIIGRAKDFGICKATKKDGTPCTKAVNASECSFCEYHVPRAIKDLANASRQMTGKRNAPNDFKARLTALGVSTTNVGKETHMSRPGGGVLAGAPASSARAQEIIKAATNGFLPKGVFGGMSRNQQASRASTAAPRTMSLDEDDEDFGPDDNVLLIERLKRNHTTTVERNKSDKDLLRQRAVAAKLQTPLEKSDPNDVSAKKPTGRVTVEQKPLPSHLSAIGLVTETVESMQKKYDREVARRKELEIENEELRRRLQAAESSRAPMADVSNAAPTTGPTFGIKRPVMTTTFNGIGQSKTQKLFGCVAANTMKSRYADDADEEDHDELMNAMDKLEERDQLSAQLALKREVKRKVWHCAECRVKTPHFPKECRDNGHVIKEIEALMRYFKCKACNETNVSYDALLPKNCRKNGCTSTIFMQVTAADVTAACKPTRAEIASAEARGAQLAERESLNARGVEHGFRLDTIHSST